MNSALKYGQSFGKCDEQDMILCSTLSQRAAHLMQGQQSGAKRSPLRAACVNRTPTPSAVMYGRFAHVTGLRMYVRWEWLPVQ